MTRKRKTWVRDDGGRKAAGFKGEAKDCVVRAIAIATGKPYREVHDGISDALAAYAAEGEDGYVVRTIARRSDERGPDPDDGGFEQVFKPYLRAQGWRWTSTMEAGAVPTWGTAALPPGRLIVDLCGHVVAVVDGVARDTYDSVGSGRRRVYGYWQAASIADRINDAHAECEKSLRASVEHAIRAGELLLQAKKAVGHGDWTAWLAENVKFSDRLAQAYMRIARLPVEKRNAVADLPLREALSAIRCREKRPGTTEIPVDDRKQEMAALGAPSPDFESDNSVRVMVEQPVTVAPPNPITAAWEKASADQRRAFVQSHRVAIRLLQQEIVTAAGATAAVERAIARSETKRSTAGDRPPISPPAPPAGDDGLDLPACLRRGPA